MEQISIYGYIALGYNLRYLQDADTTTSIHADSGIIYCIDYMIRQFDEYNLKVTSSATTKLKKFADKIRQSTKDYIW